MTFSLKTLLSKVLAPFADHDCQLFSLPDELSMDTCSYIWPWHACIIYDIPNNFSSTTNHPFKLYIVTTTMDSYETKLIFQF